MLQASQPTAATPEISPASFSPSSSGRSAVVNPATSPLFSLSLPAVNFGGSTLPSRKALPLFKKPPKVMLEGTVVSMQTRQDDPTPDSLLTSIFMLLRDVVWPPSEQRAGGQKKTVTVM